MKTVNDIMTRDVVWVSPSAKVKTAVILLRGHEIGALPVVYENSIVGVVTSQELLGQAMDSTVVDVMQKDLYTVSPETSVQDAADKMSRKGVSHLLVVDEGGLVGIVSHSDVLRELGKYVDPLTGLPASDAFREWIRLELMKGRETSIIFFDIDLFWLFNKKHGHDAGDRVLVAVADEMRRHVDPDLDLLCRIGGDEFGIATLRSIQDATDLAARVAEHVGRLVVEGVPEGVTVTYGIAGGRRTKEREETHYAATVDGLLNIASRDCTARKPHRAEAAREEGAAEVQAGVVPVGREPRLAIDSVTVSSAGSEATVTVSLAAGDEKLHHTATGYAIGRNILRLVAEATAGAVGKSLAPGYGVVLDEVVSYAVTEDQQVVTASVVFVTPKESLEQVGSAVVRRGDPYRAAAAAVLNAVNRMLATAPKNQPEDEQPQAGQE